MRCDSGDPDAHADEEIRPDRTRRICTDVAQQGRHPKRTQDQADHTAEEADQRSRQNSDREPMATARNAPRAPGPQQIDPEDKKSDPDHDEERVPGKCGRDGRAADGADDGDRRHPTNEPPVDTSRPDVRDARSCRGEARDADVRAGAGAGARGREHDHWQADVAEHEADEPSNERRREAPGGDREENENVQPLEYRAWRIGCAA
jgi:hypothetical protein